MNRTNVLGRQETYPVEQYGMRQALIVTIKSCNVRTDNSAELCTGHE